MKTIITALMLPAALILALVVSNHAQDTAGGPPPHGHRPPPPSPVIGVLDANHDHVIDASEIAKAASTLLSLDRNGDGQLTPDEFCPPPPPEETGAQ